MFFIFSWNLNFLTFPWPGICSFSRHFSLTVATKFPWRFCKLCLFHQQCNDSPWAGNQSIKVLIYIAKINRCIRLIMIDEKVILTCKKNTIISFAKLRRQVKYCLLVSSWCTKYNKRIRGSNNYFVHKCDNFVIRWNFDFIFKPFLKNNICNTFRNIETNSCMRLCSVVTLATAETPHGALLFLEACCHAQNSITSVFDIIVFSRTSALGCRRYMALMQLTSKRRQNKIVLSYENLQWSCGDVVMHWLSDFDQILLFANYIPTETENYMRKVYMQ